jgi:hypothetical protein
MSLSGGRRVRFLIAAFACVTMLFACASAHGASSSAQAAGSHEKRKKVCQKRRKRGIPCKKRSGPGVSIPDTPRTLTLTWDSTADIDLHVYDFDGHQAGLEDGIVVNGIPGATHSGNDTDGFGPESYNDPSGRRVGFLVCWITGPSANITVTDSRMPGVHYTAQLGPPADPPDHDYAYTTAVGWEYVPDSAHC